MSEFQDFSLHFGVGFMVVLTLCALRSVVVRGWAAHPLNLPVAALGIAVILSIAGVLR